MLDTILIFTVIGCILSLCSFALLNENNDNIWFFKEITSINEWKKKSKQTIGIIMLSCFGTFLSAFFILLFGCIAMGVPITEWWDEEVTDMLLIYFEISYFPYMLVGLPLSMTSICAYFKIKKMTIHNKRLLTVYIIFICIVDIILYLFLSLFNIQSAVIITIDVLILFLSIITYRWIERRIIKKNILKIKNKYDKKLAHVTSAENMVETFLNHIMYLEKSNLLFKTLNTHAINCEQSIKNEYNSLCAQLKKIFKGKKKKILHVEYQESSAVANVINLLAAADNAPAAKSLAKQHRAIVNKIMQSKQIKLPLKINKKEIFNVHNLEDFKLSLEQISRAIKAENIMNLSNADIYNEKVLIDYVKIDPLSKKIIKFEFLSILLILACGYIIIEKYI